MYAGSKKRKRHNERSDYEKKSLNSDGGQFHRYQ
jgi:hypothetical protein